MSNFWTQERSDKAADMWVRGLSASEIAKAFGDKVSRNAVIGRLDRMGVKRSTASVPARVSRAAILWPTDKIDQLKSLCARGLTYSEIADAMGISRSTVAEKLRHLGLKRERFNVHTGKSHADKVAVRAVSVDARSRAFALVESARPLIGRPFGVCAWPVGIPGRPGEQLCCGAEVHEGSSYCARPRAIGTAPTPSTNGLIRSVRRAA